MISDVKFYSPVYVTAESRVLYLIIKKKYGTMTALAKSWKVSRQFIDQCLKLGPPLKYVGFLHRKFGIASALLDYKTAVILGETSSYETLLNKADFFSGRDKKYVLQGSFIRNCKIFAKASDETIYKD